MVKLLLQIILFISLIPTSIVFAITYWTLFIISIGTLRLKVKLGKWDA